MGWQPAHNQTPSRTVAVFWSAARSALSNTVWEEKLLHLFSYLLAYFAHFPQALCVVSKV